MKSTTLTERRQSILKLVVQEFIEKATPVASDTLVRRYELPFSSATVRNELAALEELGLLTQLHTSAGRIPTDAGYRFFVEHLMDNTPLSPEEQHTIRHQFYQVRHDIDQWLQLAASLLARTAQNASVVTPPRSYEMRLKHLELISIYDKVVLLVLVLHDGTVMQQTLSLDTVPDQHTLRAISAHISDECADAPAARIQALLDQHHQQKEPTFDTLERHVLELVIQIMSEAEYQVNEQIHRDGLLELLSQPECIPALTREEDTSRAIERMHQMLELMTSSKVLHTLIVQTLHRDGVHVVIGSENANDEMREYSVVLSRYGINGTTAGVIGVIGPTRMYYPRSISAVRSISCIMSDLLCELYGGETRLIDNRHIMM